MVRAMFAFVTVAGFSLAMFIQMTAAETAGDRASKYAGQENRAIKSLSADDMIELRRGGGWGLAKAAELNGVPGPAHLLELKNEIGLTPEQVGKIQVIYDQMKADAIVLGNRLIAQELELEERFQSDIPSAKELKSMLNALGVTRSELRFVHLATHLKTPNILTYEQIASYNRLRGYTSSNPCANIPKGHNAAMWKKHNGCE